MIDPTPGRINPQFVICCARCGHVRLLDATKAGAASTEARQRGWKLTRNQGWLCPLHSRRSLT